MCGLPESEGQDLEVSGQILPGDAVRWASCFARRGSTALVIGSRQSAVGSR